MGALLCHPENREENSDVRQIGNTWLGLVLSTGHPRRGNGKCFLIATSVHSLCLFDMYGVCLTFSYSCSWISMYEEFCFNWWLSIITKLYLCLETGTINWPRIRSLRSQETSRNSILDICLNFGLSGCGVQRGTCTRLCGRPTGD